MRIYIQTTIVNSDMEWEVRINKEERLKSPQKQLPTCDITTPYHLNTATTTISQPPLHRNPTTYEVRDVWEWKRDSCKDGLAVHKVSHASFAEDTYPFDSLIRG